MTPGILDLYIEQGATYNPPTLTLRYKDTKEPYDLSIYESAHLDIKARWWDTSLLFSMTTANGRLTLGGAAGTISRLISATDTAALTWVKGVYVLRLVKADGEEDAVLRGNVFVGQWTSIV